MNVYKKDWFSEINDRMPGIVLSFEVNKVLHNERSDYQDVLVVETKAHGKLLALDGLIQCTESDEFLYHENVVFLPLSCHPNPENILIVGGGDGGVAREVAKYPGVKSITLVEIDSCVLKVAKKYLPSMSVGLSNPKLNLHVGDGFEYMKNHTNEFDVIITDDSDPVGPSLCLYRESYFKLMRSALRPGGIVCSQAGIATWPNLDHISQTIENCRSVFAVTSYSYISVPTYPTGQLWFVIGSLNPNTDFEKPLRTFSEKELDDMKMRYYSTEVHRAAFVLPRFIAKMLKSTNNKNVS